LEKAAPVDTYVVPILESSKEFRVRQCRTSIPKLSLLVPKSDG
jgi:hypothetical protein